MSDLSHVIEMRRHLVDADAEVRIRAVQEDVWINYPTADHVVRLAGSLLKMPTKTQAPCQLVYGAPGMGKTTLYTRLQKLYGFSVEASARVASLSLTEESGGVSNKDFTRLVVRALTANNISDPKVPDETLLNCIRLLNVRMLLIDELNEILNCSAREARKNLSLLKKLSGAPFSISIVALGTDECESAIAYEKQMARRFERLCLAPWYESDQLRSFLASYESTFPFRLPSGLSSESYVKYLIKESHGVLDDMVKIIINAAVWAIVTESDRITLEILKQGKIRPVY